MLKLGVISGSGLDYITDDIDTKSISVDTIYGKPSSDFKLCKIGNVELYILSRHSSDHSIAPHNINYRANIKAFADLGIDKIIAFASSGAINKNYPLGSLILSDNAIDKTYNRVNTFYDKGIVAHIDLSYPFCAKLRKAVIDTAKISSINMVNKSVAICSEGPRIETASEINYYKIIGADTVGMTLFPEVALARELQLCYVSIAIISNYGAGINNIKITADELNNNVSRSKTDIKKLLSNIDKFIDYDPDCGCRSALQGAIFYE